MRTSRDAEYTAAANEANMDTAKTKAAVPYTDDRGEAEGTAAANTPEQNTDPAPKHDDITELGGSAVQTTNGQIYTLSIIGQIEGHQTLPETVKTTKYEHVLPLLAGIEENDEISGLLLLLNTVGGDIEAGLAIAELISGMRKPTVSLVLGGGHSIGVPLAVAARKCMIARSASMTIHPVRMTGMVVGAPQTYQYFNKVQDQILDFVTTHSRISKEKLLDYMMATGEIATDVGTVLYGSEAVECGLIERVGDLGDALDCLHELIAEYKNKN